mmetsp:Transcript_119565/g.194468  ORF Transcript_119565/g.194468 Transcript_119565/m.194468 type:complete len:362 (-) Transcript_119565:212-1297(-)
MYLEMIVVPKPLIHGNAELICDGVPISLTFKFHVFVCSIQMLCNYVHDHLAVLHPIAANLSEVAIVCAVSGDELCHLCEHLLGVDFKLRAFSIKITFLPTMAPRSKVTTIFVTNTLVSLVLVVVTTLSTLTTVQSWHCFLTRKLARVWCVRIRPGIRLPDVHLVAASTIMPSAHIATFILRVWFPAFDICFTINELYVVWTLSIAIASAKLGAGLVCTDSFPAIFLHLNEVNRAVHATLKLGHISGESKLSVHHLEHLILVVFIHVQTGTNANTILVLVDKFHFHPLAILNPFHTISAFVSIRIHTLKHAPACTIFTVVARAIFINPLVSFVTVFVVTLNMHPTPVGINGQLLFLYFAAAL